MERYAGTDQVILLFETYNRESRYLHESVRQAGYDSLAIVTGEEEFLPEGVCSVYELFSGDWKEERSGKPRFFNEIAVPDHWSISAGVDEPYGRITYQHEEKGRICYFEPQSRHLVKAVDWLDRKGNVSFRDHYNCRGNISARTFYNTEGQPLGKTWFSAQGCEVLVENDVTGDLILNDGELVKHFRSREDLICYYFNRLGFGQNRIFYNSLSLPFAISGRLGGLPGRDILFWQQEAKDDIPENMQRILNGEVSRTKKVVVQNRYAYERLSESAAGGDRLQRLGFIYPFQRENTHRPEALIYTDSDRIEHCEELIEAFPQMQFHIAAITVMSDGLKRLGRYRNVSLYPAVKSPVREELFDRCDYYFDINYYAEIISAVHQAFIHNQLIFAFRETLHSREYVAEEHIYPVSEYGRMVSDVRAVMGDRVIMEQHLKRQLEHALAEDREVYVRIIGP